MKLSVGLLRTDGVTNPAQEKSAGKQPRSGNTNSDLHRASTISQLSEEYDLFWIPAVNRDWTSWQW